MHFFKITAISLSLCLLSINTLASEVYIQSTNFYDSEAVPFSKIEKDWAHHYRPGTRGITYQWHETGVKYKFWGLGFFQKKQTYLKFHEETALAVHTIGGKLPINNDEYRIELTAKYYNTYGLRLFHTPIHNDKLQITLGMSLIYGEELTDGTLKGGLTALSDKDYEFNDIRLNYYYSEDKLFDHDAARPVGEGYSFDTEINWRVNSEVKLRFVGRDMGGKIDWFDAPKTVAVVESDNKTVDENGYTKVDPTLSGNQRTENFTQQLAPFFALRSEFGNRQDSILSLQLEHYYIKDYQKLGWGKILPLNVFAELVYELQTRAAGFNLKHKYAYLSFMSDHYDLYRSHVLTLSLGIHYQF
ncbi:MAG: hypothetical protein R3240_11505 [Gammaproteobacteria bacterium]|nr:hypothetical protein [Gammaproteobacteria bacterium]